MSRRLASSRWLICLTSLAAVAGCGTSPVPSTRPSPTEPESQATSSPTASPSGQGGAIVSGVFQGYDPDVLHCAWLETDSGIVEVRYPPGWRYEYQPIRLVDPTGALAANVGDVVTIRGEFLPGELSFCRGPVSLDSPRPFIASEVVGIRPSPQPP